MVFSLIGFLRHQYVKFGPFLALLVFLQSVDGFTGSEYALDTEYSGANFFDGWDFFTGRDPTGGFVTYYSYNSSLLAGLVNSSDTTPAYVGVDFTNELPLTPAGRANGAGRPSVRISSQRSWTHGLFIGDFNHAPAGICGTWPAFWTLGPNWPYTGEVDIMEGVNKMASNIVSLHTNETCVISGNSSTQLGLLSNTNCAYYPASNVGCGTVDPRPASYSNFNSVGGGVYAMQWTSEYIKVWFFPRNSIPKDIQEKKPDPSGWGLAAANLMGNCVVDQHFQQHRIIFDTTFCGEYAGNPYVWNSTSNSCAVDTGYATCDAFVAKRPEAFRNAYWSINYVRVYQLLNPASPSTEPYYIASLQSPNPTGHPSSAPSASVPTTSLCPTYNFTTINDGELTYEIECNFDPPGPDLPPPYANFSVGSFEDCVAGCTYWNTMNGTNSCGAVAYDESIKFCYFKKYVDQTPKYRSGFAGARLIYYGYPEITDNPRSQTALSTSTFVEIVPIPQTYRPLSTVATPSSRPTFNTTSVHTPTVVPPPLGTATNETVRPTIEPGIPTVSYTGTESLPVTDTSVAVETSSQYPTTHTATLGTPATNEATSMSSSMSSEVIQYSTTTKSMPATTSTYNLPGPNVVGSFRFDGCKGTQYVRDAFVLSETSSNMTIERCVSICSTSRYAGIHESNCYCIDAPSIDQELAQYPTSACDIPCPGDPDQRCGGTVSPGQTSTIAKRQATNSAAHTSTVIVLPVPGLSSSTTSTVTGTTDMTVTAIATTWLDYCSTCPAYETTLSMTVTVPCPIVHKQAQAMYMPPSVPMITTVRHCNCGPNGTASTTTVTIPCESEIASLKAAAQQIISTNMQTHALPALTADSIHSRTDTFAGAASPPTTPVAPPTTSVNGYGINETRNSHGDQSIFPPASEELTNAANNVSFTRPVTTFNSNAAAFTDQTQPWVFTGGASRCISVHQLSYSLGIVILLAAVQ